MLYLEVLILDYAGFTKWEPIISTNIYLSYVHIPTHTCLHIVDWSKSSEKKVACSKAGLEKYGPNLLTCSGIRHSKACAINYPTLIPPLSHPYPTLIPPLSHRFLAVSCASSSRYSKCKTNGKFDTQHAFSMELS